ncbi:uncharacterized protein [Oscarella lobularis]|uniref:uncharacterized protein isoform X2 n=1 Tax=Oscarella lobularis TaxID=121494 RepID=UPI0033142835
MILLNVCLVLFSLLCVALFAVLGQGDSNLYPFGSSQGDIQMRRVDDGVSSVISIPTCFYVGRTRHRDAYISSNGLVAFDDEFRSFRSVLFPGSDLPSIVAPFWDDINTNDRGSIFYQAYTDVSSEILQQANNDVKNFTSTSFDATWGLVATWDRVSRFGNSLLVNTFQVVIVSDERTSYALFNYPNADQFQWSGSAVIGYVASDLSTFENHVLSHNDSIISVVSSSNVGVPGRYLYRVSGTVGCNDECVRLQCENGGTCTSVNFPCSCRPGYTGTFCETEIDKCYSNPCLNGGTCSDQIASFTCDCPPDFSGLRCHIAEPRCSSRIENCTDFVQCAKRVFPCDSPNYLDTFFSRACGTKGNSSFNTWLSEVLVCLANLTSNTIADVYGLYRNVAPFGEECRLVDHRLFNGLGNCVRRDNLCNVSFDRDDAIFLRDVLESSSSSYRDVNFDIMLDVVRSCPSPATNVDELRSVLEARDFVICGRIEESFSSIIQLLRTVIDGLISGTGSSLRLSDDALLECESRLVNKTSGVFGVTSNGTNSTSLVDICLALNSSDSSSDVAFDCPLCGDGIVQVDSEECDDGRNDDGDGCSAACLLEDGFGCRVPVENRTICFNQTCGDGLRVPGEDCDSGSSGFGCDLHSCLILDSFECPVNNEFDGPSRCFNCGNGIREFFEECDTPNDGCNNTCGIVDLFACAGELGEESECEHAAVDFDFADNTTLNRTVVYRKAVTVVLLAPMQNNLDASAFGDQSWREVVVELTNALNGLRERVIFSTDTAVLANRLTVEESARITGISTSQFLTISGTEGLRVLRGSTPVNLSHVLLSIGYFSSISTPDFNPRHLLIKVIDSNGYPTPVVGVTVQFVGENDNAPVLTIGTPVTEYEEGLRTPIDVTSNSLNLSDSDHQFHLLRSATVKICSGGSGSLAVKNYPTIVEIEVKNTGKEIVLTGSATTDVYKALLNNVTYVNSEPDFEGLADVFIEFNVSDGKFWTIKQVRVRLIDFNVAPLVNFFQSDEATITYIEGHPPSFLSARVNITDLNDASMAGATVSLLDGHVGDALVFDSSIAEKSGVTVHSRQNRQNVTLSGRANITIYEMILSSFGFVNNYGRPVNLSSDSRIIYVVLYDGQSRSVPAKIRVVVIPVNDEPILRFTPTGQPVRFAPLANRSHSITYTENGSPVKILPSRTILVDVDSFYAGNATILFNASRSGDIVLVNMSTAARHGVVVIGQGTSSVLLSGIASLDAYLEILFTATYNNTASEPDQTVSQVIIRVWDDDGASSLPVFIFVFTEFVNDGPSLDLGVGVGKDDRIRFIENQEAGQRIVSRPLDVSISDSIEGNSIERMTVELTADYPDKLDDAEYIYLLRPCDGLSYQPDPSGKLLTFTGLNDGQLYACTIREVFYASSADEPTNFLNGTSRRTIGRKIVVTVFDNGHPSASSSAVSHVDVVNVNDNSPQIVFRGEGNCISEMTSRRRRRRGTEEKGKMVIHDEEKMEIYHEETLGRKKMRVNVTSIQVKGTSNDRLNPGATIFVKFSHETNTPRIRMPSNLLRIVTFSPEHLNNVSSIALWDDKRTLAIVFPNGAYYPRSTTSYQTDDVKLTFNKSPHIDPCNESLSCDDGICHSSGISCRVTGTYALTYDEKPSSPSSFPTRFLAIGVVVDETTTIVNWAVVALAIFTVFVTSVIVVAFGWRHKRTRRT